MSQQQKYTLEYKSPKNGAHYRVTISSANNGSWICQKKTNHRYNLVGAGCFAEQLRYHLNSTLAPADVYEAVMNAFK